MGEDVDRGLKPADRCLELQDNLVSSGGVSRDISMEDVCMRFLIEREEHLPDVVDTESLEATAVWSESAAINGISSTYPVAVGDI